ncbi:MAG: hypothetical protein P8J37_00530 [Fuerstiella sp.]|jgi:hypothetical protein|nr:hypothetical protein [Fuerstiella sp.]
MSNPYSTPDDQSPGQPTLDRVQSVRALKIITFALVSGVLTFMGVALAINRGAIDGEPKIMSWIGIGMAGLMIVNHLVLPNIVARAASNRVNAEGFHDADEATKFSLVFPAFQTRHIVASAMLEFAAFMNLLFYLLTAYVGNLAAASVLVVVLALRFPTVSAAEFWVQDRIREIELS